MVRFQPDFRTSFDVFLALVNFHLGRLQWIALIQLFALLLTHFLPFQKLSYALSMDLTFQEPVLNPIIDASELREEGPPPISQPVLALISMFFSVSF